MHVWVDSNDLDFFATCYFLRGSHLYLTNGNVTSCFEILLNISFWLTFEWGIASDLVLALVSLVAFPDIYLQSINDAFRSVGHTTIASLDLWHYHRLGNLNVFAVWFLNETLIPDAADDFMNIFKNYLFTQLLSCNCLFMFDFWSDQWFWTLISAFVLSFCLAKLQFS